MSSQPHSLPSSGEGPLTSSDVNNLSTVIHILGGLEKAVNGLEATTESHTEKIEQLTQWVSAIPYLEKSVAQSTQDVNELGRRHDKDLNDLGRRFEKDVNELGRRHDKEISDLKNVAHTASALGKIALVLVAPVAATIIIAILTSLYHAVERLLFLK